MLRHALMLALGLTACAPAEHEPGADAQGSAFQRLSLLSDQQHANAIFDLVAVTLPEKVQTPGVGFIEFSRDDALIEMTGALHHQYASAARYASAEAVTTLSERLPCYQGDATTESCATDYLLELASRAFRRPLSSEEEVALLDLYRGADDVVAGIEMSLEAILQSPDFLYRREQGEASGDIGALTPHEKAAAIALLLLDSVPDEALWQAARDNSISDPSVLQAQVDRLLAMPRVQSHLSELVLAWLGVEEVRWLAKAGGLFPEFNEALAEAMVEETRLFIHELMWARDADLKALLTSTETFVTPELATLYGAAESEAPWAPITLPAAQRAGVLTHASMLATLARSQESSIVYRGLFVERRLFCSSFPPPPDDAIAAVEDETSVLTERDFADFRAEHPDCSSCHQLFDPYGIAMEHYDAIGRWREEINGIPVRAQSLLSLPGAMPVEVSGTPEMAALIAEHPDVAACVAKQFLQQAYGRSPSSDELFFADQWAGNFRDLFRDLAISYASQTWELSSEQ